MKKIDGSEVLNMSSTIQVRVEDELKSKSDAPMTEAEMLAKLKKSREYFLTMAQVLFSLKSYIASVSYDNVL